MHPRIYREFERICTQRGAGGAVLEVGAVPCEQSLLCMRALDRVTEKVGLNLDGPYEFRDFKIVRGNANAMTCFADNRFDVVLSNAMLEHDKHFWKTLAELKRVLRPGGLLVIGVPAFEYFPVEKIKRALARLPLVRSLQKNQHLNMLFTATITYELHNAPGDYYRFSRQACEEVIFAELDEVEIRSVMLPPRLVGAGRKPRSS
jgi:SAM-dependent methyltransferase